MFISERKLFRGVWADLSPYNSLSTLTSHGQREEITMIDNYNLTLSWGQVTILSGGRAKPLNRSEILLPKEKGNVDICGGQLQKLWVPI